MKNTELEIVKPDNAVARPQPTVADMLQTVIQAGVTKDNVAAMEQLVQLYERMEARKAEQQFASAFVALQADMPRVQATKAVPNNDGSVRYHFAPLDEIMKQVSPYLQRHGFTLTFSTDFAEGRLIKLCTLQHIGGHSKTNKFAVRIGSGPPKATESQADGAASTYAKRFALCDCLNIQVAGLDNDARAEGGAITAEQAKELAERVRNIQRDAPAFLKFAGAPSFEQISSVKYEMLDQWLAKAERLYMEKIERGTK